MMTKALLQGLMVLLSWLPLSLQYALGGLLGTALALIPNRSRRISQRNLELCLPELDSKARRQLLWQSLRETARAMLETPLIWRASRRRIDRLVRAVHGEDLLDAALAKGQGVIIASPHLGSWEFIGQYLQGKAALTCLFKPTDNPAANALMQQGRGHLGMATVPTDAGGVRQLFAILKRGGMVGILPDQDPRDSGVFAPFFGIPALTMSLLPKLAARSQATVLVGYAERLPWGGGYAIHLLPCSPIINSEDIQASASALNAAVETAVRQCPAQYQWSYKRFRSRPAGVTNWYAKRNGN